MAPRRKGRRFVGGNAARKGALGAKTAGPRGSARSHDSSGSSSGSRSRSGSGSRSRSSDDDTESSDYSSDEDSKRDYKKGGYHPVVPFQVYNGRYRVLSKLGAGAFSTVWLCADEKDAASRPEGPELVAMKVCKSKKSVTEQAVDEIALLDRLQAGGKCSDHVVQLRSHFWHCGPHSRHKGMAFEVMGENLLALVKHYDYDGLPLAMVKRLARHTLKGLEYIHACGVIHTDVKLENVLIRRHDMTSLISEARGQHRAFTARKPVLDPNLSKNQKKKQKKKAKAADAKGDEKDECDDDKGDSAAADGETDAPAGPVPSVRRQRDRFDTFRIEEVFAKLADFGNGCHTDRKVTDDIQTRQYRSPEIIIGSRWNETADCWSAACMFFELITGDFLFDPRTGDDWCRDEDHLALMIELLGDLPPKDFALSGRYSKEFFSNAGKLKHIKSLKYWTLTGVLTQKYSLSEEEANEIGDFLLPMLRWDITERKSASATLSHSWIQLGEGETDDEAVWREKQGGGEKDDPIEPASVEVTVLSDAEDCGQEGASGATSTTTAEDKNEKEAAVSLAKAAPTVAVAQPEEVQTADAPDASAEDAPAEAAVLEEAPTAPGKKKKKKGRGGAQTNTSDGVTADDVSVAQDKGVIADVPEAHASSTVLKPSPALAKSEESEAAVASPVVEKSADAKQGNEADAANPDLEDEDEEDKTGTAKKKRNKKKKGK